jgi:hypothetical protein
MTYFDCFVVGSWMSAIGWFFGAIYVQNHCEKTESPRMGEELDVSEKPERCQEGEAWRLPVVASASVAAD